MRIFVPGFLVLVILSFVQVEARPKLRRGNERFLAENSATCGYDVSGTPAQL